MKLLAIIMMLTTTVITVINMCTFRKKGKKLKKQEQQDADDQQQEQEQLETNIGDETTGQEDVGQISDVAAVVEIAANGESNVNETNENIVDDNLVKKEDVIITENKEAIVEPNIVEQNVEQNFPSKIPETKISKINEEKNVIKHQDSNITIRISDPISDIGQKLQPKLLSIKSKIFNKMHHKKLSSPSTPKSRVDRSAIKSSRSNFKKLDKLAQRKDLIKLLVPLSKQSDRLSTTTSMNIRHRTKDKRFQRIAKISEFKKKRSIIERSDMIAPKRSIHSMKTRRAKQSKRKKEIKIESEEFEEPDTIETKDSEEMIIKVAPKAIKKHRLKTEASKQTKFIRKKDVIKWIIAGDDKGMAASKEQPQSQRYDMKILLEKLLRKMNFWPKNGRKTMETVPAIAFKSMSPRINIIKKQLSPLQQQQQQQQRSFSREIFDHDERLKTILPTMDYQQTKIIKQEQRRSPLPIALSPTTSLPQQQTIRVSEAIILPQKLKLPSSEPMFYDDNRKFPYNQQQQQQQVNNFYQTPNWYKQNRMMKYTPNWTTPAQYLWQKNPSYQQQQQQSSSPKKTNIKSPKIKIPKPYHLPRY